MNIKLQFLGAADNVTGSRYLVEANGSRVLVDCGLYQEREFRGRNWDPFPVPPETLNAVLLTHAHLDHCGLIPKLVREGFTGHIYCTAATADIAQIMLMDSAKIQMEDAEFKKRRHEREGRKGPYPEIPLYTMDDAQACSPLFSPVAYAEPLQVADGISATFHDAGHVLGSSMLMLRVSQNGDTRSMLFSGDVGRWDRPMLRDPTLFDYADYVLVESTYGNRVHDNTRDVGEHLADIINTTLTSGGNIVVPSFALERSQEILFRLNELLLERRIPRIMVFLDSPMAVNITDVFQRHPDLFDEEMTALMRQGKSPFDFPGLTMIRSVDESKAINKIVGTAMIIAGSGMCTGGRIKHHLVTNISRRESTIIFVGYQASGTLGRHIVDGAEEVRILGQTHRVRARIVQMHGFSAHADRNDLFRWLSALHPSPRHIFVVHGESNAAHDFAHFLSERLGGEISTPAYRDEVTLS